MVRSLRRDEAVARARLLTVVSYDVVLDLTGDARTFRSTTRIVVDSAGGRSFLQVQPVRVHDLRLDDTPLDPDTLTAGRLPVDLPPGRHEILVDADLAFRTDGEGLHRSVDPADGRSYVYAMTFMDAAPTVFACFDQPDLKAPVTLHVAAPADWVVVGNGSVAARDGRWWHFETTRPLPTYLVALVAGPYHVVTAEHDGIPLGLSARASLAAELDAQADELLSLTRQSFDELHRLFGIRYAFGGYHQAFVPEFNAGAMESPGCVTFRDPMVFTSKVTRYQLIERATTIAHEMAHQWFGNLTSPVWWDDLWLNESFAEYMGTRVTADATEYADAWTMDAHTRRPWGLDADLRPSTHPVAGNGAEDAASALENFDGISYAKGAAVLRQLNARLGDPVFLGGAVDHFERHRFGNGTMAELLASWERAGASDLSSYVDAWLCTAGADTLAVDRDGRSLRCTTPPAHPARRTHTLVVATGRPGEAWRQLAVTVAPPRVELPVDDDAAVVIDAHAETWAVSHLDPVTQAALPALLRETTDAGLRAGIWSAVRTTYHDALMSPGLALALVESTAAAEDGDYATQAVAGWASRWVVPLCDDPAAAEQRLHAAWSARAASAPPGSGVQLAAFQGAVATARSESQLARWCDGQDLPPGLSLDENLGWRLLVRRAVLGGVDRAELDDRLGSHPTATARVDHARASAALPDPAAKAAAWAAFLGETEVTTYELEALADGLWQHGQEHLTDPYVDRYFSELPGTAEHRHGELLGRAARWFFPHTSVSARTIDQATHLLADDRLEPGLDRAVVDRSDDLARRLAIRTAFCGT